MSTIPVSSIVDLFYILCCCGRFFALIINATHCRNRGDMLTSQHILRILPRQIFLLRNFQELVFWKCALCY